MPIVRVQGVTHRIASHHPKSSDSMQLSKASTVEPGISLEAQSTPVAACTAGALLLWVFNAETSRIKADEYGRSVVGTNLLAVSHNRVFGMSRELPLLTPDAIQTVLFGNYVRTKADENDRHRPNTFTTTKGKETQLLLKC